MNKSYIGLPGRTRAKLQSRSEG